MNSRWIAHACRLEQAHDHPEPHCLFFRFRNIPQLDTDLGANAAAAFPVGFQAHPARSHHFVKIVGDAVGEGFVEDAFIAVVLKIELEAFELDAHAVGAVTQCDRAEIGMTGLWAEAGEPLGHMLDEIVAVRVGIVEALEEGGLGHRHMIEGRCRLAMVLGDGADSGEYLRGRDDPGRSLKPAWLLSLRP